MALAAPALEHVGDVRLFEQSYSPRRVRYWLGHWEELEVLTYSPKTSAHVAEHMAREWELLRERPRFDCLCRMDDGPACAETPGGGRRHFRAAPLVSLLVHADLVAAANALPPHWKATRVVYEAQGRLGEWTFRYGIWKGGARARVQDRWAEPMGADRVVVDLMARMLGSRPR